VNVRDWVSMLRCRSVEFLPAGRPWTALRWRSRVGAELSTRRYTPRGASALPSGSDLNALGFCHHVAFLLQLSERIADTGCYR
jgi:hypothetical protein